jgi:hypothetical protein
VSTKVARPIPLIRPDNVNVPVPEAFKVVSPGKGPVDTRSEVTLSTTKEAVSPFSVIVKLPFGLMLNSVPAVKELKDPIDPAATLAGLKKVIAPPEVYESLPVMLRVPEIVSAHANEAEAESTMITASIIFKLFINSSLGLSSLVSQVIHVASALSSLPGNFFFKLKPNELGKLDGGKPTQVVPSCRVGRANTQRVFMPSTTLQEDAKIMSRALRLQISVLCFCASNHAKIRVEA